jgi:hypothetical protein
LTGEKKTAKNIIQNHDWAKMRYRIYVTGERVLLLYSTIQVLRSWQESELKGCHLFFFFVAQLPYSGLGRLVLEIYYAQYMPGTAYMYK